MFRVFIKKDVCNIFITSRGQQVQCTKRKTAVFPYSYLGSFSNIMLLQEEALTKLNLLAMDYSTSYKLFSRGGPKRMN